MRDRGRFDMAGEMRKVLFLGNCQAASLSEVYAEHLAPGNGDAVSFVACTSPVSEADIARITEADLIVEQVFDFKQYVTTDDLDLHARVVRFPTVSCAFLWPFAGANPPAKAVERWPAGTYFGPDLNDRFLNKLIDAGADPDEAVAAYLALDAETMTLDKRYDFVLRRQRRRDEIAGSAFADTIAAHFRDEQLFFGPYHPGARVFRMMMADVLQKIGLDVETIARTDAILTRSPLDLNWLPVHPAVAAHFGLRYIAEGQRYRSLEGGFTFSEWASRYVRFEWNRWLWKGEAQHQDPDSAIPNLQIGLLYSPESARGHRLLAEQLYRRNHFEYAAAALRRAIALDPAEPRFRAALGHALAANGEHEAAAEAFRQAVALNPEDPGLQCSYSHALCATGRLEEALAPARLALDRDPARRAWNGHLANVYALCGRFDEAEAAYREAIALEPENAAIHAGFAELLASLGRREPATKEMRRAFMLAPDNPRFSAEFAKMLADQDDAPEPAEPEAAAEQPDMPPIGDPVEGGPELWFALDIGASEIRPNGAGTRAGALPAPADGQPWAIGADVFASAD